MHGAHTELKIISLAELENLMIHEASGKINKEVLSQY